MRIHSNGGVRSFDAQSDHDRVAVRGAHGQSVSVPFRRGIGGAIYDDGSFINGVNFAVRAPLEIGLKFHNAPIELYGEVALMLTLIDDNNNNNDVDLQGGIGFRVYF